LSRMFSSVLIRIRTYPAFNALNAVAVRVDTLVPSLSLNSLELSVTSAFNMPKQYRLPYLFYSMSAPVYHQVSTITVFDLQHTEEEKRQTRV